MRGYMPFGGVGWTRLAINALFDKIIWLIEGGVGWGWGFGGIGWVRYFSPHKNYLST